MTFCISYWYINELPIQLSSSSSIFNKLQSMLTKYHHHHGNGLSALTDWGRHYPKS